MKLAGAIATDSPVNPRLLWQLLDLQLYMKLKGQVAALVSYHMNGSIPFNGIIQQTAETMPLAFYRWKSIKRTCENLEEFPPLLRKIQKVTHYLSYWLTYLLAYLLTDMMTLRLWASNHKNRCHIWLTTASLKNNTKLILRTWLHFRCELTWQGLQPNKVT